MAIVNFNIVGPTAGAAWSGSFSGDTFSAGSIVTSTSMVNLTDISSLYSGSAFSFDPVEFGNYSSQQVNHGYVTWRSVTTSGSQYQTAGKSLDIWSDSLRSAIFANLTWDDLIDTTANDANSYPLNPNKWTLTYDYDYPYAAAWSKGGAYYIF